MIRSEVTDIPITFQQAAEWVSIGSVASLSNLLRSQPGLDSYRAFKESVGREKGAMRETCLCLVMLDGRGLA